MDLDVVLLGCKYFIYQDAIWVLYILKHFKPKAPNFFLTTCLHLTVESAERGVVGGVDLHDGEMVCVEDQTLLGAHLGAGIEGRVADEGGAVHEQVPILTWVITPRLRSIPVFEYRAGRFISAVEGFGCRSADG